MRVRLVALLALCMPACCSSSEDPPTAEVSDLEFRRCGILDASGGEKLARGRYRYERDGYELDVTGPRDGIARLGAMAGLEDASPATLTALDGWITALRAAGVEGVVVAGGIGSDEASARAVLDHLGHLDVPVLLVPGTSEPIDALRTALAGARAQAPNLVDMGVVRVARLPDVTVLSLPGGTRPHELLAGEDGCGLTSEDIEAFGALVKERPDALAVSATPPRQRGPAAIDVGRSGASAGDPRITTALARAHFGVFGTVYESGGHASDRRGGQVVTEGQWGEEVFLNPGAADALPRGTRDGALGPSGVAILEIQGKKARFRMLRPGP